MTFAVTDLWLKLDRSSVFISGSHGKGGNHNPGHHPARSSLHLLGSTHLDLTSHQKVQVFTRTAVLNCSCPRPQWVVAMSTKVPKPQTHDIMHLILPSGSISQHALHSRCTDSRGLNGIILCLSYSYSLVPRLSPYPYLTQSPPHNYNTPSMENKPWTVLPLALPWPPSIPRELRDFRLLPTHRPILDQSSLIQTVHFSLPGQPPSLLVPHCPSPNSPFLISAITPSATPRRNWVEHSRPLTAHSSLAAWS